MRVLQKQAWLLLVVGGLLVQSIPAAQTQQDQADLEPGRPTSAQQLRQQLRGEDLFYRRCPLCHEYLNRTRAAHASTRLIGLYQRPGVTDAAVRQIVIGGTQGLSGRMPSFQYTFTEEELDDLIAYLRIR